MKNKTCFQLVKHLQKPNQCYTVQHFTYNPQLAFKNGNKYNCFSLNHFVFEIRFPEEKSVKVDMPGMLDQRIQEEKKMFVSIPHSLLFKLYLYCSSYSSPAIDTYKVAF